MEIFLTDRKKLLQAVFLNHALCSSAFFPAQKK